MTLRAPVFLKVFSFEGISCVVDGIRPFLIDFDDLLKGLVRIDGLLQ